MSGIWGFWTEEKKQLLRERYPHEGPYQLAEELGTTVEGVKGKAYLLKVKMLHPRGVDTVDHDYFKVWSQEMAYCLGYIWADGSVNRPMDKLTLECAAYDRDAIEKVRACLKSKHALSPVKGRELVSCQISSTRLAECLVYQHGVIPSKSKFDCPFPEVPQEFLASFCRGNMDGDGGLYLRSGAKVSFCGSSQFIHTMQDRICQTLGVPKLKSGKVNDKFCVQITWGSRKDVIKIIDWMYPEGTTLYLDRKYAKSREIIRWHSSRLTRRWTP